MGAQPKRSGRHDASMGRRTGAKAPSTSNWKGRTIMRNWKKLHQQKAMWNYGTESINGGMPSDIVLPGHRRRKAPTSKEELRALAELAVIEWSATRGSSCGI